MIIWFYRPPRLAKHDENYTPPEVADAMNEAHKRKQEEGYPGKTSDYMNDYKDSAK